MQNKRGQELSTNAIILIILGVLVLVVLVVGFVIGWGKIGKWFAKDNVNDVVDSCNSACTTKSVYDFCLRKRDVTAEGTLYGNLTCNYIATKLSTDVSGIVLGVSPCVDLACTNVKILGTNIADANLCTDSSGSYVQSLFTTNKKYNLVSKSC